MILLYKDAGTIDISFFLINILQRVIFLSLTKHKLFNIQ